MEGGDHLQLRIHTAMARKRLHGLDLDLRHLIRMLTTQRTVKEGRRLLGLWVRAHQGLLRGALALARVRELLLGMPLRPDRPGGRRRLPVGLGLGHKRQRGQVLRVHLIHIKMDRKEPPMQQVHGEEVLDRRRLLGYHLGGMLHLR